MMLQLNLAVASYAPALRRGVKLSAIKQHALKVFDRMYEERTVSSHVYGFFDTGDRASFLFGGYSWFKKKIQLWKIEYSDQEHKFQAQPTQWACYSLELKKVMFRRNPHRPALVPLGEIALAGNQANAARKLLFERLTASRTNRIDFEPFEVVRDMLRDPSLRDQEFRDTIGGVPQVVKVYQYMNAAPIGVY